MADEHLPGIPNPGEQTSLEIVSQNGTVSPVTEGQNVFRRDNPRDQYQQDRIRRHKQWLDTLIHEYPMPYSKYRIGVYIRYFNQTKHENYLDYHKQQFIDTISLCPNWQLVDFYIDTGISAPSMESSPEWCRLLEDCFSGKVNLIVTQKASNVSRRPEELAFISRILAAQRNPVGIYFISEDLFTLASYYQAELREKNFLPDGWELLPDDELDPPVLLQGGDDTHATADD
jgi:Resolvase, N terminal domain.